MKSKTSRIKLPIYAMTTKAWSQSIKKLKQAVLMKLWKIKSKPPKVYGNNLLRRIRKSSKSETITPFLGLNTITFVLRPRSKSSRTCQSAKTYKFSTKSKYRTWKIGWTSIRKKYLPCSKRSRWLYNRTRRKTLLSSHTLWARSCPKGINNLLLNSSKSIKSI